MEGLVNYSSEDEQDEKSYRMAAERGSYLKRASATKANNVDDIRRRPDDNTGGGGGSTHSYAAPPYGSSSNSSSVGGSGGGHNYKDEDSYRYKSPSKTSTHNTSRTNSQYHNDREGRDARDNREYKDNRDFKNSPREGRDNRDFNNGNRNDNRNDRFNRSREYNREQRRDHNDYRDTRKPRDDDRNYRGNSNQNRYSSSSFSSPHTKDRYKNSRFNERPNNQRSYQQRSSRDERSDNRSDIRSERYGRKQRSPDSRSPSPTSSHNKRYSSSRNDSERFRNRGRNSDSRSRSRSSTPRSHKRSPSPNTSRERAPKPLEQARSTALDLERKLNASESIAPEREIRPSLRHTEAVLSLPLNDTPKPPTVIAVAPTTSAEPSVIQLPSYYNPSVINPNKYAEQVQKRKLIWGAKKAEDTSSKWGHAQFSQDSDGKVASKFMRLMGIKGGSAAKSDTEAPAADEIDTDKKPSSSGTDVKSREQMFSSMEQQYEVARQVTHTMRGVGLGFSSQSRPY